MPPTRKELIDNELIKTILIARIDTAWRMLSLKQDNLLPKIEDEGATGAYDNKGALFIPGGIVFEDSDSEPISIMQLEDKRSSNFRANVLKSMQHDNATLLYHDGIASAVNLNNSYFASIAAEILANRDASLQRKKADRLPNKITSEEISRSYSPLYLERPYGSRTKLSSCIPVCLSEPKLYHIQVRNYFRVRGDAEEKAYWGQITSALQPIEGRGDTILAQPHIIVCHNTRYREGNYSGITRILGCGKFGEFATLTLEEATSDLLNDVGSDRTHYSPEEIVAQHEDIQISVVLRIYPPTSPGKRSPRTSTSLIAPERELDIDLKRIEREAKARYNF
jgi:hypothetical protein